MSDQYGETPPDLATIAADDQLLDLLGTGAAPENSDDISTMLAAWRADVASETPTVRRAVPAVGVTATGRTVAASRGRSRPVPRSTRVLVGAAAALVALAGTVTVLASDARPGSPLWPITRLLYQERASSAVAEQDATRAIDQARQAITNREYVNAAALLDQAADLVGQVRDSAVADRLRAEITALRSLLPDGLPLPTLSPDANGGTPTSGSAPPATPTGILPLPSPTCLLSIPDGLPLPLPTCLGL